MPRKTLVNKRQRKKLERKLNDVVWQATIRDYGPIPDDPCDDATCMACYLTRYDHLQ